MNPQNNGQLLSRIETGTVILLLLSGEVLNIPPFVTNIINAVSYVAVILLVIWRFKRVAYVLTKEKVLLLSVGFACASLFWSALPVETFTQIRALIRTTLFGAYLATRYTVRQQMNLLSWTIGLVAILTIIICIVYPSYGISITNNAKSWQGFYAHKQYLGIIMGLGASLFLVTSFKKYNNRWLSISFLFLTFSLVLLSASKTGLIVFLVTIPLVPLYQIAKQQYLVRIITLFTILLIGLGVVFILISNQQTIVVDILGKDAEFNGRLPIWNLVIEKILERPWLGYGYAAFWKSDAGGVIIANTWAGVDETTNTGKFHAHNGFLEIALEIGILGLLILLLDIFMTLYRVIKLLVSTKTIESFWQLVFLAIVLTINLSEAPTFLSTSSIFWMIHTSVAFSSALECNRISIAPHLSQLLSESKMTG